MKAYSSAGFSMIEAMVAVGLVSGLALAGMQMTKTGMGLKKKQDTDLEATSIVNLMRSHLDNPKSCMNSFGNQNITDSTVTDIKDYRATTVISSGMKYSNLTLNSIKLKSTDSFVAPGGVGFTNVYVTFRRPKGSAGTRSVVKKFKLWVSTNSSNSIVQCSAIANYSFNLWRRSYFDPFNILYTGGNVSVGGDTATAGVHSHGNLQAATEEDKKIIMGGSTNSNYEFILKSDMDLIFKNRESGQNVDINANVVKVTNEIRPTVAPSTPCTEEIVGAIRIHPTQNKIQFCGGDHTKWISFVNE